MPGATPDRRPDSSARAVAADLEAIEHRLKAAQDELSRVTRERQEALDRLAQLHAERTGEDISLGR
jgi:hypothetical protein